MKQSKFIINTIAKLVINIAKAKKEKKNCIKNIHVRL